MAAPIDTRSRALEAAIESFGIRGVGATSLDNIAADLGVSKQTVLYHFGSKDGLLEAAIDNTANQLTEIVSKRTASAEGWDAVESVVKSVSRVAVRRPALLGLLREVTRLGPPWSTRAIEALQPLVDGATAFLQQEMDNGRMRQTDSRLLLLSVYSTVMGVTTEMEVLRAVGIEPTLRELLRRRRELIRFLKSALVADD